MPLIHITRGISIDEADIKEEFIRSGGPGGQHVNKVSTAVQLRFNLSGSKLPPDVKERLVRLAGSRLTDEGTLIITARDFRKREQNRASALERLVELVRKACIRPIKRVKTKPTRGAKERRITEKKLKGRSKRARQKVGRDDQ